MKQGAAEVIVAGHICLDVIPSFGNQYTNMQDILVPGKLIDIGRAVTASGGAVSNTGLALHRLGLNARLMGKVGDDLFGRALLDILQQSNPRLAEGMIVTEGENSSYTIVINPPETDRVFLHCTGANDTFIADDLKYEEMAGAKHFHFGYPPLMRQMYTNDGREIVKIFSQVKDQGLTTSLDLAKPDPNSDAGKVNWKTILQRVLPFVDVFLPSFEEILFMLDRQTYDELERQYGSGDILKCVNGELLSKLAVQLLDMGAAVVALKLGEHGLYVRTTKSMTRLKAMGACAPKQPELWLDQEMLAPCFLVDVVGTTGAGDCTIAGFLTGLLKGHSLEETIIGAVAVGACNVEGTDATSTVPTWEQVCQRIEQGWQRRNNMILLEEWNWEDKAGIFKKNVDND